LFEAFPGFLSGEASLQLLHPPGQLPVLLPELAQAPRRLADLALQLLQPIDRHCLLLPAEAALELGREGEVAPVDLLLGERPLARVVEEVQGGVDRPRRHAGAAVAVLEAE